MSVRRRRAQLKADFRQRWALYPSVLLFITVRIYINSFHILETVGRQTAAVDPGELFFFFPEVMVTRRQRH